MPSPAIWRSSRNRVRSRQGLSNGPHRGNVGFSAIVSLGDKIDVDFSDCLDFFSADSGTRAILLYIESIDNAKKFMSAARAAARVKPVVVIKAGRHAQGAKAAATHTGALAGSDAVYDAAFRRAGLLRVLDLDQLFAAAETLGRQKPFPGNRLAVLTNGGGIGVLAVDRLMDLGGTLATISETTRNTLDAILPPTWSHGEPDRHHRRCEPGALCGRPGGAARGPRERCRSHPQRADGRGRRLGCGRGRRERGEEGSGERLSARSRSSPPGSARTRIPPACSKRRAFRISPRRPMRCAGSCSSCATARRRTS